MNSKAYSSSFNQFIALNSFGKLVLNPKAASLLRSLPAPISMVSMIGPRSSGKSFLLSQLANEYNSASRIPEQLEPNTSVCVCAKPLLGYNQHGKITTILLFDTPGIDLENERAGRKLLVLMLLISTSVFYNTKSPLSEEFMREMGVLTNLLDLFPSLGKHFARSQFSWIFRDFNKKIENQFGARVSEKQYFQNSLLALSKTHANAVHAIRTFLPHRNSHFFIQPNFDKTDQHPLFWEQVIKLRKSLTDLPSMDIEGSDFILLLSTYVESLNNDDSLQKVIQEGRDCVTRIRCLDRLNDELKSLEQQSMNSIDGIQQKLLDIKANLNEYFKQRMMSTKQIQALDEELAEILHEFRELNDVKAPPQSRLGELTPNKLRVRITGPEKAARYSINVEESDVEKNEFQDKSMLSFTRLNTSKAIQSRLEECEARLYRYELESDMMRTETDYFKDEYEKSKKELEVRHEQFEEAIKDKCGKEKEYEARLQQLEEQLQGVQKERVMALSENEKLRLLSNDKISYLEAEIAELSQCYKRESEQREERYKAKINEYVSEIAELSKAHEEEVAQLKLIYKSNIDKMVESSCSARSDRVIRPGLHPDTTQLTQDLARTRAQLADSQAALAKAQDKVSAAEERARAQAEKTQKRLRDVETHLHTIHTHQLSDKDTIITDLQAKHTELLRRLEQTQSSYHALSEQASSQLRELRLELLQKSERNEQNGGELAKYEGKMGQYERELQQKDFQLRLSKNKIQCALAALLTLEKDKSALAAQCKNLKQDTEKLRYQHVAQRDSLTEQIQTHKGELQALVAAKHRELQELKKLQLLQKQGLLTRLQEQNQELQIYRPYKYHFEDLQQTAAQKQSQYSQLLMERESSIASLRQQLDEADQQLAKNQQHINFLTNSLADLNQQYSNNCDGYSSNLEEMERHCSQKINAYVMQTSQLSSELKELRNGHQKAAVGWQRRERQYQQQLSCLAQKNRDETLKYEQKCRELASSREIEKCREMAKCREMVECREMVKCREMANNQQGLAQPQGYQLRQKDKENQQLQSSSKLKVCSQVNNGKVANPAIFTSEEHRRDNQDKQPRVSISISNVFETSTPAIQAYNQIQKEQLNHQIRLLREKIEKLAQKHHQELAAKHQHLQKLQQAIQICKTESALQILKEKQKNSTLQHQTNLRQVERQTLIQNINDLQAKYRCQRQKTQNYLNLLQRRIKQSKEQNEKLTNTLQQYKSEYQQLQQVKKSLEFNYGRDSALWSNKYALLQQKHSLQ